MERIKRLLKSAQPVKWVFEGDSITHGALHTFGYRDYSELFCERIRFEMGRGRDFVIKSAISGNTTRDLLRDFDWRVRQFQPQAVFIMIGMNDCSAGRGISREEFGANLTTLSRKIAELPGAVPVLQTTCPVLPGMAGDREPNIDAYMDIVREVAGGEKLPLIDHTKYWKEYCAAKPGSLNYWLSDPFHPNNFGHQVFAECLFKTLGIFDPAAASCQFFHP